MAIQDLNSDAPKANLPTGDKIQIIEHTEDYEDVGDGVYEFTGSRIVYKLDQSVYFARTQLRLLDQAKIRIEDLTEETLIPIDSFAPIFTHTLTKLDLVPTNCYIKRPRLGAYDPAFPHQIANHFMAEAQTCELLKQHPHQNIARYLGCEVQDGRITGLYFHKYEQTLLDRINPNHYNKRAFVSKWGSDQCHRYLKGIESGVEHLHAIGLVHNDVNPANLMFDDGDNPVLIDFGSCVPVGQSLGGIGGTYEWYDETVRTSRPENDHNAIAEIREWLSDKPEKNFKFKE